MFQSFLSNCEDLSPGSNVTIYMLDWLVGTVISFTRRQTSFSFYVVSVCVSIKVLLSKKAFQRLPLIGDIRKMQENFYTTKMFKSSQCAF